MNASRPSIAWLMTIVVIVAMDLTAYRAWFLNWAGQGSGDVVDLLVVGGLPMLSLLAVNALMMLGRRERGGFLFGFQVFGVVALVIYVVMTMTLTHTLVVPYAQWPLDPVHHAILPAGPSRAGDAMRVAIGAIWLTLPQMALAIVGGLVFRRFAPVAAPHRD